MPDASEPEQLRHNLRAITADGAMFSVMVGIGETYIPAFVIALGMGDIYAGLIAALPMLPGAVIQLVSPIAVQRIGSFRRWVVLCVTAQALSFVPLLVAAIVQRVPPWAVMLIAAAYWAGGMGAGPAWNTWVGLLIPTRLRAEYFGRRTRVCQAGTLLGLIIGGLTLQAATARSERVAAFALLFAAAAICRSISARYIASQSEPPEALRDHRRVSFGELISQVRHGGAARLLMYLMAMQAAAQVAGPYFTPFMLRRLQMSYATYMALIAAAYLSKVVVSPWLGRLAARLGPRRLMWMGGLGIIPLPALWMVSTSFWYLLALQTVGGFLWGMHELAYFLMFFEAIREEERTSLLTTYNLLNALALVTGAAVGAGVLYAQGDVRESYYILFTVSSACRVGAFALLARVRAT